MVLESDNPIINEMLKPLAPYFRPDVSEIAINMPGQIKLLHTDRVWRSYAAPELSLPTLWRMTELMAKKNRQKFDGYANSAISFELPGGHRTQVIAGSNTEYHFSMTIRIKKKAIRSIEDFHFSPSEQESLIAAVKAEKTLLISGATETGKTSCLNTLLTYSNPEHRTITIEGVREVEVPGDNHLSLLYSENASGHGCDPKTLLNDVLRMSPKRIIFGEIRKQNAFPFAEAINTGHEGSMATIHANDPVSALNKIVNYAMQDSGVRVNPDSLLEQLKNAIYGVVQLVRQDQKVQGYFEILNPTAQAFASTHRKLLREVV